MLSAYLRRAGRVVTLAVALTTLGNLPKPLAPPSGTAYAAGPGAPLQLPAPKVLALPASTFPRGSHMKSGAQSNTAADASTLLHTTSLTALGRVEGYHQMVRWSAGQSGRQRRPVALQYGASIFSSPAAADAAYSDARASLWELGHPIALRGYAKPAFAVMEHGGINVNLVAWSGPVELEMSLTYGTSIGRQLTQVVLAQLGYAGAIAIRRARQLATRLVVPSSSVGDSVPPVYVAPLSTGPVVKSPSLMTLEQAQTPAGTTLGAGVFRAIGPRLSALAEPYAAIAPPSWLSRYVQLGAIGRFNEFYSTTSLFRTAHAAAVSFAGETQTNQSHAWLHSVAMQSYVGPGGWLARADGVHAWRSPQETIFLLLCQNVVITLATTAPRTFDLPVLAGRIMAEIPSWLHAQGTTIEDAAGMPVHLDGLNWYGAEQQDFVVGGLDYQPYQTILQRISGLGYNSIRVPFSNQLVEQNPVVSAHLGANPELVGMHALDILDRVIAYAGALGLSIILDNHRSDAGWSGQENGLWYTPAYPEASFDRDWMAMAQRYAGASTVIGADLRNEPHGAASWGDGNPATDWRAAAGRVGSDVLRVNPHLLVIVEGVQFYGAAAGYWWGGNLMGVAGAPVILRFADGSNARSQLIYSAHDYGKDNCAAGCPWLNNSTTYDSLAQTWDQYWGYIAADAARPYAAPVWVGEFGTCNYSADCVVSTVPGSQGQWFSSLIRYLGERHLSWSYWSANGTQSTGGARLYGDLDWYGFFSRDWTGPDELIADALKTIQTDGATTPSGPGPRRTRAGK